MKNDHRVIIVQDDKIFSASYSNIIVIPTTSFEPKKHWDSQNNRLKYVTHHLLHKSQYSELKRDTIVKCEQLFTIEKRFLDRYLFTLNNDDMEEILKRIALVLGFNRI
ncbi:type II toxin-antitoxin system PemK/MazF family toxin [Marinitoga lauensis]|uniref:type II toxin-antitoxin system PemK/MazF family toxin n=1 Tax=Marinitoga lauensis TaxID=2201189 RepID=UPI0010110DED|nr:type II toxin-antitoxin system PemK/MazF family toxin [Marinitoga lauensis]